MADLPRKTSKRYRRRGGSCKPTPQFVEKSAYEGMGQRDILRLCGINEKHPPEWFRQHPKLREAYNIGKAARRADLIKKQTELALSGNTRMLVWLGKQELGQSEKEEKTLDITKFTVDEKTKEAVPPPGAIPADPDPQNP